MLKLIIGLRVKHNRALILLFTVSIFSFGSLFKPRTLLAEDLNSELNTENLAQQAFNFLGNNIEVPNFINDIFQDFNSIVGEISTFLNEVGIEVPIGEIGLPDVEQAKDIFAEDEELDPLSDLYGTQTGTTFANKDKLLQQYLRDLSEEYSENSALSSEGQEKIQKDISIASETAEASLNLAEDSSGQDVSQNILRNISNQLSLQEQMDAMAMIEMEEDKVGNSLELQMNSEALTEISKQTTRAERESIAANRYYLGSIFEITIPGKRD